MSAFKRTESKWCRPKLILPVFFSALFFIIWSGCSKQEPAITEVPEAPEPLNVSQDSGSADGMGPVFAFIDSDMNQSQYMKIQPMIQAAQSRAPEQRTAEDYFLLAVQNHQTGDFVSSVKMAQSGLDLKPKDRKLKGHLFYIRGRGQIAGEDYKKAKGSFQNAMLLIPDYEPAILQMGWIYLNHENNLAQAKTYFEMGMRRNPNQGQYYIGLGEVYRAQGDLVQAEKMFVGALRINPVSSRALYNLGTLYVEQKDYDQAAKHFERLAAISHQAEHHFQLAEIYLILHQTEKAEKHFKAALESNPKNPQYHVALAKLYRSNNPDLALKHLQAAVEIQPDLKIYLEVAKFYSAGKNYEKSMDYLEQARKLEPGNAEVHSEMGRLWILQKKYKEARAEFEKALQSNPDNRQAAYYLGLLNLDSKDPALKEQRQWAQKVLENPNDPVPHYILGTIYLQNRNFDLARWEAETLLSLDPQLDKGHILMAQVYFKEKDYDSAEKELFWLTQHYPGQESTLKIADGYYERTMKLKEWENFYRKLYSSPKDALALHYALAKVFWAAEDIDRLIQIYNRLTELETDKTRNTENYSILADLYEEKDDRKYAALTIKKALMRDPKNETFKARLEQLQKPQGPPRYMENLPREYIRDLIVPSSRGWTPLHTAAANGKLRKVKRLVERGVEIDAKNEAGLTPLHEAIKRDQMEVVQYLVEHGAKIDAVDPLDDVHPIHIVLSFKRMEMLEYLVTKGVNLEAKTSIGDTPLIAVSRLSWHKDIKMARFLVKSGAKINAVNNDGCQALCYAAQEGNLPLVKFLLSKGAEINFMANNGVTPLIMAIMSGDSEVVEYLLESGADASVSYQGSNLVKFAQGNDKNGKDQKRIIALLKRAN